MATTVFTPQTLHTVRTNTADWTLADDQVWQFTKNRVEIWQCTNKAKDMWTLVKRINKSSIFWAASLVGDKLAFKSDFELEA